MMRRDPGWDAELPGTGYVDFADLRSHRIRQEIWPTRQVVENDPSVATSSSDVAENGIRPAQHRGSCSDIDIDLPSVRQIDLG
jgi:hypothetical protein